MKKPNLDPVLNCRHFTGYKPCGKSDACDKDCASKDIVTTRVLLVHLGALGAVVRSTALLPAIRRRFHGAHITWVTDRPGDLLLREHPLVDRILTTAPDDLLSLRALHFDVGLVVDKSLKAAGVVASTKCDQILGFIVDAATGAIAPATEAARESWELGLSNHLKFNINRKTETQLLHEALELGPWVRDDYSLFLSVSERVQSQARRADWSSSGARKIIGLNTGCASTIAYKKLSIDGHVSLLEEIAKQDVRKTNAYVLLGGREDTERNFLIAHAARAKGVEVTLSPTEAGLRDGMISVDACDVVVTGDSLGMHMAIGFHKPVVAWFGPTCAHEIDLYGRGEAILTKAPCSPCWKRTCTQPVMCYDRVDFEAMARAVTRFQNGFVAESKSDKSTQPEGAAHGSQPAV